VAWPEDTGNSAYVDALFLSSSRWEAFRMNPSEQKRFDRQYANALQAKKMHGLRKKTIDSNCLTLRRVASFFEEKVPTISWAPITATQGRLYD